MIASTALWATDDPTWMYKHDAARLSVLCDHDCHLIDHPTAVISNCLSVTFKPLLAKWAPSCFHARVLLYQIYLAALVSAAVQWSA
jgi:hypothetical protein